MNNSTTTYDQLHQEHTHHRRIHAELLEAGRQEDADIRLDAIVDLENRMQLVDRQRFLDDIYLPRKQA